jgi:hypothetical protein
MGLPSTSGWRSSNQAFPVPDINEPIKSRCAPGCTGSFMEYSDQSLIPLELTLLPVVEFNSFAVLVFAHPKRGKIGYIFGPDTAAQLLANQGTMPQRIIASSRSPYPGCGE